MDAKANVDEHEPEGLIPEIEEAMARDEAEWSKSEREESNTSGRDERGRFTGASNGQRTGQADAEQELEGEGDSATTEQSEARSGEREARSENDQSKATQSKKDGSATAAGRDGQQNPPEAGATPPKPDAKPADGRQASAWQKENERKARTWEGINATKAQLEADREQLKLEREALTAQQSQAQAQVRDAHGYTAEQYERAATTTTAKAERLAKQALEAEQAGDFAKADQLHSQAGEAQTAAKAMQDRASGLKGGNVWDRLKADLPEALQFNGPINVEIRKLLRGNPQLLGDPMGPYRAAVQVGRSVLQATEQKLATANVEAAKVPGLLKQIEELSARVKELQAATSLPGGGAAMSRGGSGGRKFEDLSVDEMERELQAEAV